MRAPLAAPGRDNWEPVDCSAVAPARDDTRLHPLRRARRPSGADASGATASRCSDHCDHDGGNVREVLRASSRRHDQARARRGLRAQLGDHRRGIPDRADRLVRARPRDRGEGGCSSGWRFPVTIQPATGPSADRTGIRRHADPGDDRPPAATSARRQRAVPAVRLRRLRGDASTRSSSRSLPRCSTAGVVYAVAHIRGGGECGRRWWQQGRLQSKPTTFTRLISRSPTGWPAATWTATGSCRAARPPAGCSRARCTRCGRIAGGRWSPRCRSSTVVTTMLDASIPLTANEWEEWGDPRQPDDYALLRSYSPTTIRRPAAGRRCSSTGAVHDREGLDPRAGQVGGES